MLQELYKAGMLPIPLMHVRTLRINFIQSDTNDDNVVPAISLLLKGAVNVEAWSTTNGKFWLMYKPCSIEIKLRQVREFMKAIVKVVPEKRCLNFSLMHASTWMHTLKYSFILDFITGDSFLKKKITSTILSKLVFSDLK
jgi:hypothetical protein